MFIPAGFGWMRRRIGVALDTSGAPAVAVVAAGWTDFGISDVDDSKTEVACDNTQFRVNKLSSSKSRKSFRSPYGVPITTDCATGELGITTLFCPARPCQRIYWVATKIMRHKQTGIMGTPGRGWYGIIIGDCIIIPPCIGICCGCIWPIMPMPPIGS